MGVAVGVVLRVAVGVVLMVAVAVRVRHFSLSPLTFSPPHLHPSLPPPDWSTFPVYSALVHGCTFATDLGYVPNQGYGATFTCPNYYDALPGCARNTEVTPLQSIPHSAWLSIVTMTTTGFGDINPVTGEVYGDMFIIYLNMYR